MSSPTIPLILAREADDDFAGLLQYTCETWGEEQVAVYRATVNRALLTISQHPRIGRRCAELGKGFRVFPAGQHVVIYEIHADTIRVHRILHSRMDISSHV